MKDRDAVLQAILDTPADDFPRLAYADLCDEAGEDSLAHFIRDQIANPNRIQVLNHPAAVMSYRGPGCRSVTQFRPLAGCEMAVLQRGFISRVTCPLQSWLDHGADILAAHPVVRVECGDAVPRKGRDGWHWHLEEATFERDQADLPEEVWVAMGKKTRQCHVLPTKESAITALSDALIKIRKPKRRE